MIEFTAPAPCEYLSMNHRQHWAPKAKAAKAWRTWAYLRFVMDGLERDQPPSIVTVELPVPDKRRRDPHNYHPTLKAIVDGLVDARCWPDDTPDWVAVAAPVLVVRRDRLVTVRLTPVRDPLGLDPHDRVYESAQANGDNDSQQQQERQ